MVLSSAITIAGPQAIAEVCLHMSSYDHRTFCDLQSAIHDHLRSYGNQPLAFSSTEIVQVLFIETFQLKFG